jgi:hypothetical protein
MTFSAYSIPEMPPAELLAELDAAAEALDALTARAAELTLAMDEERRRLRIELRADGELRALTPTQLLELLG